MPNYTKEPQITAVFAIHSHLRCATQSIACRQWPKIHQMIAGERRAQESLHGALIALTQAASQRGYARRNAARGITRSLLVFTRIQQRRDHRSGTQPSGCRSSLPALTGLTRTLIFRLGTLTRFLGFTRGAQHFILFGFRAVFGLGSIFVSHVRHCSISARCLSSERIAGRRIITPKRFHPTRSSSRAR